MVDPSVGPPVTGTTAPGRAPGHPCRRHRAAQPAGAASPAQDEPGRPRIGDADGHLAGPATGGRYDGRAPTGAGPRRDDGQVPRPLDLRARPRGRDRPHRPRPALARAVPAPDRAPSSAAAAAADGGAGLPPAPRPPRPAVPGRLGPAVGPAGAARVGAAVPAP